MCKLVKLFFYLLLFRILVRSLCSIESQTCSEACNPSRQARRAECSENLLNKNKKQFNLSSNSYDISRDCRSGVHKSSRTWVGGVVM